MTLDRTISPQVKEPDMFRLQQPRRVVFPNATELYILDMGEQDVCRIDLMWEIGNYEEPVHLSADMANKMLKEGAGGMSAGRYSGKAGLLRSLVANHRNQLLFLCNPV